jgi:hypothetical protein
MFKEGEDIHVVEIGRTKTLELGLWPRAKGPGSFDLNPKFNRSAGI